MHSTDTTTGRDATGGTPLLARLEQLAAMTPEQRGILLGFLAASVDDGEWDRAVRTSITVLEDTPTGEPQAVDQ